MELAQSFFFPFLQVPYALFLASSFSLGVTGRVFFLSFLKCIFEFVQQSLAQTNSVARTLKPTGITRTAGPGSTIIAIPSKRTVEPTTITMSLFACCNVFSRRVFMNQNDLDYDGYLGRRDISEQ
jgi:hypothetical protein